MTVQSKKSSLFNNLAAAGTAATILAGIVAVPRVAELLSRESNVCTVKGTDYYETTTPQGSMITVIGGRALYTPLNATTRPIGTINTHECGALYIDPRGYVPVITTPTISFNEAVNIRAGDRIQVSLFNRFGLSEHQLISSLTRLPPR